MTFSRSVTVRWAIETRDLTTCAQVYSAYMSHFQLHNILWCAFRHHVSQRAGDSLQVRKNVGAPLRNLRLVSWLFLARHRRHRHVDFESPYRYEAVPPPGFYQDDKNAVGPGIYPNPGLYG